MFKHEWRQIFLPVVARLSLAFILPVMVLLASGKKAERIDLVFFIGYAIVCLWIAMHLGLTTFRSELRNQAFEYIFTFPCSRFRLLWRKIFPRLLAVLLLILGFAAWYRLSGLEISVGQPEMNSAPYYSPQAFASWMLFLFIFGFFLSLVDWGNLRPALPLLMLVSQVLLGLILEKLLASPGRMVPASMLSGALLLLVSGIAFSLFWRKREARGMAPGERDGANGIQAKAKVHPMNIQPGRPWAILRQEWPTQARNLVLTFLVLPILYLLTSITIRFDQNQSTSLSRVQFIAFGATFLLFYFAYFSGLGVLGREYRQRSLEYLLTFPISLRRIMAEKVLSRILVLVPAVLALCLYTTRNWSNLSAAGGFIRAFLHPALIPVWIVFMFLSGLFLALFEMKNLMALVSLVSFYTLVIAALAAGRILRRLALPLSPTMQTALPLLIAFIPVTAILATAFLRLLPRFDLAAPQCLARTFGMPLMAVFSALSAGGLAVVMLL